MKGFMTQQSVDAFNNALRAEAKAASTKHRSIRAIKIDICQHWENINYAAQPYLAAMDRLYSIDDHYGLDSARSIVTYFLGNANGFRGEDARRLKAELKEMLK